MSVYKNTSWGRTRGPKNVAGSQGGEITALADTSTLVGIVASTAGYATENQRYLHVLIEETNDGGDTNATATTIFGYCHAFQRWFEIPETNLASANTAATAASIVVGDSGAAPVDQTPDAREYRLYHTVGVDRVAFVGTDADVNVFAAGSTF